MPKWRNIAIAAIAGIVGLLAALERLLRRGRPRRWLPLPAREIFVANHRVGASGRITVARFPGDADGDVAPTSELYVNNALAVARDWHGNIYVASDTGNQVRVYDPATVGTAPAPLRTIQGLDTKVHRPSGLAVDSQGNLYVAERGGVENASAVLKFAPGADGNVAPIAVIPSRTPPPGEIAAVNTGLDIASGVALDYDGSIYVVTCPELGRPSESKLLRFNPDANGDVAPVAEITMGLSEPQQVALTMDGSIYVTNRGANPSITVHAPEPSADVAPVRTITSADLVEPCGIALDNADRIFIAEPGQNSVLVFDAAASGNVPPLRRIQGPNTGLNHPLGIAVRVL
jgi:sugar lactone lactonase YvrE